MVFAHRPLPPDASLNCTPCGRTAPLRAAGGVQLKCSQAVSRITTKGTPVAKIRQNASELRVLSFFAFLEKALSYHLAYNPGVGWAAVSSLSDVFFGFN
jgi:hypothetical protein